MNYLNNTIAMASLSTLSPNIIEYIVGSTFIPGLPIMLKVATGSVFFNYIEVSERYCTHKSSKQ